MTRALSRIGSCAARVNIGEDELFMALRAYLDSSGKIGSKTSNSITLAGLAANDEMWAEFEKAWDNILGSHNPKANYVHMKEIYRLEKEFDPAKGSDKSSAYGLSNDCLVYMSRLDKTRFHLFYCSVDLVAWRKLRAETYDIPDPVELCNTFCSEQVLTWYLRAYPGIVDLSSSVKYFFDRDEPFMPAFEARWNREMNASEISGRVRLWNLIEQVSSVDMRKTPGIQAADIMAWGVNRETFAQDGDEAKYLAHIIRQVIPSLYVRWDEAKMREKFRPTIYSL